MGLMAFLWLSAAFLFPHGDLHQQIADLSKTITAFPDSTQLYLERGELYLLNEDIQEARSDFATCLHAGLLTTHVYLGLSKSSYLLDLPDSALYYVNLALALDHLHTPSLEWKASVLLLMTRYCESAEAYHHLLSLAPQPSPALFIDAADAAEHCPDASPRPEVILLDGISRIGRLHILEKELVRVYINEKRFKDALEIQSDIIDHWTVKMTPYYDRAGIYLQMGEKDAAIQDLHSALLSIDQLPRYKSSTPAMKEMKSKIIAWLKQLEG